MTDRKCMGCQADIIYSDGHYCSVCKRNTMSTEERVAAYPSRPAPELPEGYRTTHGELWSAEGEPWQHKWIATIDAYSDLCVAEFTSPKHFPALVAFLQGAR